MPNHWVNKDAPDVVPVTQNVMPNMKNIRNSLTKPVNKYYAAILIGAIAIVLPIYGIYGTNWKNVELNMLSILLPLLWVVFVMGFIFLALGNRGRDVTSAETDQKIATTYFNFQEMFAPLWWVAVIVWLIWMGYLVWSLFVEA